MRPVVHESGKLNITQLNNILRNCRAIDAIAEQGWKRMATQKLSKVDEVKSVKFRMKTCLGVSSNPHDRMRYQNEPTDTTNHKNHKKLKETTNIGRVNANW